MFQIDDDLPCRPHNLGESNPFCMENIDVSNFLNLHSLGNHEDFCLAYVFTYRDFTGGTLGLAWVASASGEQQIVWLIDWYGFIALNSSHYNLVHLHLYFIINVCTLYFFNVEFVLWIIFFKTRRIGILFYL